MVRGRWRCWLGSSDFWKRTALARAQSQDTYVPKGMKGSVGMHGLQKRPLAISQASRDPGIQNPILTCWAMARMRQYSASALGEEDGAATLTWQPSPLKLSVPLWKQPSRSWGETQQSFAGCTWVHGSRTCLWSATVTVSETKYWSSYLVPTKWDRLLQGGRWNPGDPSWGSPGRLEVPWSLLWVTYLHRLERGREGVLQGTASQPPHLLREHGARCHEDVPARRKKERSLEFIYFIVTKGR